MLRRRRSDVLGLLADAHRLGRLSTALHDRMVAAAFAATRDEHLRWIQADVAARLRGVSRARAVASSPSVTAEDVAGSVAAFYDAISWRGDRPPDRRALQALLAPEVRFVDGGVALTAEAFWRERVGGWAGLAPLPFTQRETAGHTISGGLHARRLSAYVAERAGELELGRGFNGFELLRLASRWLIVSVAWRELPARRSPP